MVTYLERLVMNVSINLRNNLSLEKLIKCTITTNTKEENVSNLTFSFNYFL